MTLKSMSKYKIWLVILKIIFMGLRSPKDEFSFSLLGAHLLYHVSFFTEYLREGTMVSPLCLALAEFVVSV